MQNHSTPNSLVAPVSDPVVRQDDGQVSIEVDARALLLVIRIEPTMVFWKASHDCLNFGSPRTLFTDELCITIHQAIKDI